MHFEIMKRVSTLKHTRVIVIILGRSRINTLLGHIVAYGAIQGGTKKILNKLWTEFWDIAQSLNYHGAIPRNLGIFQLKNIAGLEKVRKQLQNSQNWRPYITRIQTFWIQDNRSHINASWSHGRTSNKLCGVHLEVVIYSNNNINKNNIRTGLYLSLNH